MENNGGIQWGKWNTEGTGFLILCQITFTIKKNKTLSQGYMQRYQSKNCPIVMKIVLKLYCKIICNQVTHLSVMAKWMLVLKMSTSLVSQKDKLKHSFSEIWLLSQL